MTSDVRDRMIETAIRLLAQRGYQATSFSEVLAASDAPRGSIYHHFPEGKDQMIAAAIRLQGERAVAMLDALEGSSPSAVSDGFLAMWRALLTALDFSTGCSLLGVVVSSGEGDLLAEAGRVFRAWRGRLADLLVAGGLADDVATSFAALLLAASEGAVVMARAEHDLDAFDRIAIQLRAHAEHLSTPTTAPTTHNPMFSE